MTKELLGNRVKSDKPVKKMRMGGMGGPMGMGKPAGMMGGMGKGPVAVRPTMMKNGGSVKGRGCGCAKRGHTKGKMV
jgi:hypothetical protein